VGKFNNSVISWSLKANKRTEEIHQEVATEGFRILKRRSPVKSGRFRANWRVGLNSPDLTADDSFTTSQYGDEPNQNEMKEARRVIRKAKVKDKILLTNALPYAKNIERGDSKMAPHGVIELSHLELKAIYPAIAARLTRR